MGGERERERERERNSKSIIFFYFIAIGSGVQINDTLVVSRDEHLFVLQIPEAEVSHEFLPLKADRRIVAVTRFVPTAIPELTLLPRRDV